MVVVPFPEPGFYSYLDEENFVEWLGRIPVVSSIGGDTDLSIDLKTDEIDDQSAQEFAAIAARYDFEVELPAALRKGKGISLERTANPAVVTLTGRPFNGFSLSLSPAFVSPLDERGFDDWLKESYPRYIGLDRNKTALLELNSEEVTVPNVFDLIALFNRYRLNLSRLRRLCEIADRDYFDDKEAHWYEEIFGTPRSS